MQTYNFDIAVKDKLGKLHYAGKTFNWKPPEGVTPKIGDIVTIIAVDVNSYIDPDTKEKWFKLWSPRVSRLRPDKIEPDSVETLIKMCQQTSGRFSDRKAPDLKNLERLEASTHSECINFASEMEMCKLHNQHVDPDGPACPDFQKRAQLSANGKRFVVHHHIRGSSEHIDARFQINHVLDGFTIAAQYADLLKDVLARHWKLEKSKDRYSLYWDDELAYQLDKKENVTKEPSDALKKKIYNFHVALHNESKYWKIDMNTGEEKKRPSVIEGAEQVQKIFCVKKKPEPFEWLDVVGITKPREIEPEPGGTRFWPGIFVPIDSGTYYPGAIKPAFCEYFLRGKKWKGRFVFRLVSGLSGTKHVADWLFWKPDDQTPYVLSSRAIRDNWLPKSGSAMPPEWEEKLPSELQFWNLPEGKRGEIRKLARAYLHKNKQLATHKFVLSHRYWQGAKVIRDLPVSDYHLKIDSKKFHFLQDPSFSMPEEGLSALEFEGKNEYFIPGTKPPLSSANPNKKIDAAIEILDQGAVEIIADEPLYLHVRFSGKKLKGLYYFKKSSRSATIWILKQGMASFSLQDQEA